METASLLGRDLLSRFDADFSPQSTDDYFKEYREALQAVLPSDYSFRVRKVESPHERVGSQQFAFGKVLIGRRRDKEASVWAFLEGQNGDRVMYRDSDKETVLLPLQLDDFVEFEPVFQLISDPMDLRKFASATETTRRKRWVSRIALVARLVLRDYAFYSPTIRVNDARLKKEAVVQIIRRNLDEKNPYTRHKPSRNGLKPLAELSRSQSQDGGTGSAKNGGHLEEHSIASQPSSCPAAIEGEIQSGASGITNPKAWNGLFTPSTHEQKYRQRDSTASSMTDSTRRSRSNSVQKTGMPSSPVQKRARLVSGTISDNPVCYEENLKQGSMDARDQAATSLQKIIQSSEEAQIRPLTLKGFAERKVEEARQQERNKAAQQIASVERRLHTLQNIVDNQQKALDEQDKKHWAFQERSAVRWHGAVIGVSDADSRARLL